MDRRETRIDPVALQRGVRVVATHRGRGERRQRLLLGLSVFAVLMAYYLMKPAREALLSTASFGMARTELRAFAFVAQGLFAAGLAALYGRLADRLTRQALIPAVNGLLALGLVMAAASLNTEWIPRSQQVSLIIYVGAGGLNVVVLAQFWAFAMDLEGRQAGRLLPLLSLCASAGGASGAWIAGHLVRSTSSSGGLLFLSAAVALAFATVLGGVAEGRRRATREKHRPTVATGGGSQRGALSAFVGNRYLLGVAAVTLLAQWVSSNGEHLLFGFVQEAVHAEATALGIAGGVLRDTHVAHATTAFYASFFLWSNIAALGLQLIVVFACSRGLSGRNLLLALPVVTLASGAVLLFVPLLASIKLLKVAENATRYSLNNTASHLLWLPTTAEMKYKAKIAIESTVVRLADVFAALTAFIGIRLLQAPLESMYLFNLLLVVLWLLIAAHLVKEQRRRLATPASLTPMSIRVPSDESFKAAA